MNFRRTLLGMCMLAAVGCDKLADEDSRGPVIATIRGTLSLADGVEPPDGDLYVAILWRNPRRFVAPVENGCGPDGSASTLLKHPALEQRLEIDTSFPAAFSVDLTEPPPAEVLLPFDDGGKTVGVETASGNIVVYRDVNRNGRLDFRSADGKPSPDEILGTSEGTMPLGMDQEFLYQVTYLTGDLAEGSFDGIVSDAGYSLTVQAWDYERKTSTWDARPLSEESIELVLHATNYAQKWTCAEACDVDGDFQCPDDPNDLPNIPKLGDAVRHNVYQWRLEAGGGARNTWYLASCARSYPNDENAPKMYDVSIMKRDGCTLTSSRCVYKSATLPKGIELPCTEFRDNVGF